MNILIVTDAWEPQINGVVRTYQNIMPYLENVQVVHPYNGMFRTMPLPGYREIDIVLNPWKCKESLNSYMNQGYRIHIATEGPLGLYARNYLTKRSYKYTTSFHTLFPEFIQKRFLIPSWTIYPYFRWFHSQSDAVLVPTKGIAEYLTEKKFRNLAVWTRGVNSRVFNPERRNNPQNYIVCVSRVSKEKGLDDFCQLDYSRKVLIGDGPYLNKLRSKYPDVEMIGSRHGVELAEWVANADVFVFPSKSDTFGIVILESLGCGTPVAAYNEPGPRETIISGKNGYIDDNLQIALESCLNIDRVKVHESSKNWSWQTTSNVFSTILSQ